METFVLDACSLLRLFKDEPGADQVDRLLSQAKEEKHRVLMHIINLGEVIYRIAKDYGWEESQRKRITIELLPIEFIPFDERLFWQAVGLKSKYAISYADSFAAALALQENATLATSDPEFVKLGKLIKRIKI